MIWENNKLYVMIMCMVCGAFLGSHCSYAANETLRERLRGCEHDVHELSTQLEAVPECVTVDEIDELFVEHCGH